MCCVALYESDKLKRQEIHPIVALSYFNMHPVFGGVFSGWHIVSCPSPRAPPGEKQSGDQV